MISDISHRDCDPQTDQLLLTVTVSFDSKLCIDGDLVSVQLVTLPTIVAPRGIIVTIFGLFPLRFAYISIKEEQRVLKFASLPCHTGVCTMVLTFFALALSVAERS